MPKQKKPFRILIIAPQPFYQDRGTPIALLQLLKAFSNFGYEVDLLTFPLGESIPLPNLRYIRIANPLGFKHIPVGFSMRKIFLDCLLYIRLHVLLRKNRYDCIHAIEESAFMAVRAVQHYGIPVVYDMQSSLAEQMSKVHFPAARLLRPLWFACERWLLNRVFYIGCSAGLEAYARTVNPHAYVWEWHYPNEDAAPPIIPAEKLRQELKIKAQQPVIVYTGTFEQYQGLDILAETIPLVLKELPEAVFVMVGGNITDAARLERILSAKVPLESYRLLLRQPRKTIPDFLRMADVLVSARSIGSNLPLKIIEYLTAEKPIVATDIPAHRAILNDSLAILTDISPQALAHGILVALTDQRVADTLKQAVTKYAKQKASAQRFSLLIKESYETLYNLATNTEKSSVSVIIPARNAAELIAPIVRAARSQQPPGVDMEILLVDDGSTDATAEIARREGARVIPVPAPSAQGNPAAARNIGARAALGEILVFLDADCIPQAQWLSGLIEAHSRGYQCAGGSFSLPAGLGLFARLDYYCGWYHAHPRRHAGPVHNHPPGNLSIRREIFLKTRGFTETHPIAYAHEELAFQQELAAQDIRIFFEPKAIAAHYNREGFINLIRRNFRWGYSAIESKHNTQITRLSWLYRYPLLLAVSALFLIPLHTLYITGCWLRAGAVEPLLFLPVVFIARCAYGIGMAIGGFSWILRQRTREAQ